MITVYNSLTVNAHTVHILDKKQRINHVYIVSFTDTVPMHCFVLFLCQFNLRIYTLSWNCVQCVVHFNAYLSDCASCKQGNSLIIIVTTDNKPLAFTLHIHM